VAAARADATGTTRLVFHLSAKGEVVDAEILKSSGEE
jgi:outer membrane biosynthesis protein TonB